MIRHIFKLIWNRKRSLAWIFVEQALVFGILLFCFTSLVNLVTQYYSKGTIRFENIAQLGAAKFDRFQVFEEGEEEAIEAQFRNMVERMKDWQSVDIVSINRNFAVPHSGAYKNDTLIFNGRAYRAEIRFCDENYYKMFSLKLNAGEWFRDSDVSEIPPALITQKLADNMGLTGNVIGQTIEYNGRIYRITGVVEALKINAYSPQSSSLFMPASTATNINGWQCVVKYKQGQERDFSRAFVAEFYRNFPRDQFKPENLSLYKMQSINTFGQATLQLYAFSIPTAFLLIFAFLGTFGVVWMQSKKRMSEMGLRIALGCTPARLQRLIILENLILTTLAMTPGLIVVANLYAFSPKGWEWLAAVGAAITLMWLFSAFSAWYPARQAAKVQPVEALKANQ